MINRKLTVITLIIAAFAVQTQAAAWRGDSTATTSEASITYGVSGQTRQVGGAGGKTYRLPDPCTWSKFLIPTKHVGVDFSPLLTSEKADYDRHDGTVFRDDPATGERAVMYTRFCPDGTSSTHWIGPSNGSIPQLTHEVLAEEAWRTIDIPQLPVGVSPDPQSTERPPLVNMPISWWVPQRSIVGERLQVGTMWVEVEAKAVGTSWTRSDGKTQTCNAGLGTPWDTSMSVNSPRLCNVEYQKSHDPENATVRVTWQASWRGNGGRSGQLPPIHIDQTVTIPVCQRQIVIVSNDEKYRPRAKPLIPGTCHR